MKNKLNQEALAEAIRIGEELLEKAEIDENGYAWKTLSIDHRTNSATWGFAESIYSGCGGIVLFFAELYNITNNKKYLKVATEGARWIDNYATQKPTKYYAFITGRIGVSFVMIRLYELTGDRTYLKIAATHAKGCIDFLENSIDDFINGASGALLVLVRLHSFIQEEWLNELITAYIAKVVNGARVGKEGLYWDLAENCAHGLCGFAHGAAGVGHVFLELGHYFNNEGFYAIAKEAFTYENYHWNKNYKNWPDYRMFKYRFKFPDQEFEEVNKRFLQAYNDNNAASWTQFTGITDFNAWCHGSPGIGLSRLRAWQLLKTPQYKKDALKAIAKTYSTDVKPDHYFPTFTLCHASGGNVELFIQAAETLANEKYTKNTEVIITNLLKHKKEGGVYYSGHAAGDPKIEDTSLFAGIAGIGYCLLRAVYPQKVPSILAPIINEKNKIQLAEKSFRLASINKILIEKNYKRTVCLLESLVPKQLNAFLNKPDAFSNRKAFPQFIREQKANLSAAELRCLKDVFKLEIARVELENAILNYEVFARTESIESQRMEDLLKLSDSDFIQHTLYLNPYCFMLTTKFDWIGDSKDQWVNNLTLKQSEYYILLKTTRNKIQEESMSLMANALLELFKTPMQISVAIEKVASYFDVSSPEEKAMVKEQLLQQLKIAAKGKVLFRK